MAGYPNGVVIHIVSWSTSKMENVKEVVITVKKYKGFWELDSLITTN